MEAGLKHTTLFFNPSLKNNEIGPFWYRPGLVCKCKEHRFYTGNKNSWEGNMYKLGGKLLLRYRETSTLDF